MFDSKIIFIIYIYRLILKYNYFFNNEIYIFLILYFNINNLVIIGWF
jgi:hypothetical protein